MALINSLCAMLVITPFHQENYSRLILGVIIQFYQRCSDRYQDLVSTPNVSDPTAEPQVALAARWAQRAELSPCLWDLFCTDVRGDFPSALKETGSDGAAGCGLPKTAAALSAGDTPGDGFPRTRDCLTIRPCAVDSQSCCSGQFVPQRCMLQCHIYNSH